MAEQDPGDDEPEVTIVIDSGAASSRFLASIAPKAIPPRILDPVTVTPELTGPRGRAWLMDLVTSRLRHGMDPVKDGTLSVWVVEAPWAHPIWHSYAMILVHLRPVPGGPDVVTYLEGATHEFWLFVLDPGEPPKWQTFREVLIRGGRYGFNDAPGLLTPMNFGAQFIADSDEAARERVKASVQAVVDGVLSPDTDATADWRSIWGEAMIRPEFR